MEIPEKFHIVETDGWLVNHRLNCALPGYLMISSKQFANDLYELPESALAELGPLISITQRALKQSLDAKFIYIGRYGHSPGHSVHFHVIPIYGWVEQLFWRDPRYRLLQNFAATPGEAATVWPGRTATDGAELTFFVWREFCERPDPPSIQGLSVSRTIELLRTVLNSSPQGSRLPLRVGPH